MLTYDIVRVTHRSPMERLSNLPHACPANKQTNKQASASYDNSIKLYRDDPQDWMCYDTLTGHTSTVWKCAFNATGDRLCSVADDQSIKVWQAYKPGNALGIKTNGVDPKWSCVATLSGTHALCSVFLKRKMGGGFEG